MNPGYLQCVPLCNSGCCRLLKAWCSVPVNAIPEWIFRVLDTRAFGLVQHASVDQFPEPPTSYWRQIWGRATRSQTTCWHDAAVDVDDALRPFFVPKVTGQDPGQQYVNVHLLLSISRYPDIRKSWDSTRVSSYRQFQFIDFFRFRVRYAYLMPSSRPTALHVHPDEILGNGQVLWSLCQIYVHVPYLIEKVQQILCKGIDATWEHRFVPLAGRLPRLEGWILLAWGHPFRTHPYQPWRIATAASFSGVHLPMHFFL
jgi:hypothetical protein